MTTKQFVALETSLLPELPGFAIKGSVMFLHPLGSLLRGISFDRSGFDKYAFYSNVFVMPLCVPISYITLNFGKRIRDQRGMDGWNIETPGVSGELLASIKAQAVPFLSRANSLVEFVALARTFSPGTPHTPKAIGFALARAGKVDEAISALAGIPRMLNPKNAWQRELGEQTENLRELLISNPSAAMQQLETWEAETIHNLGLEEFR